MKEEALDRALQGTRSKTDCMMITEHNCKLLGVVRFEDNVTHTNIHVL